MDTYTLTLSKQELAFILKALKHTLDSYQSVSRLTPEDTVALATKLSEVEVNAESE